MNFVKDLFLTKSDKPTFEFDKDNHVFRSCHAEKGFVSTPLEPKMNKEECTIDRVWKKLAEQNKDKPVFGSRPLLSIHTKESKPKEGAKPKKWSYFELGDYEWMNYAEADEKIKKVAMTLKKHGLKHGDIVILFCKTRAEWMITALACFTLGLVITTAYDSMPADAVNHIIKETEAKAIFTEVSLFSTLNKAYEELKKEDQPKFVFYAGQDFEASEEVKKFKNSKAEDVEIAHFNKVVEKNDDQLEEIQSGEQPKPDDLALIMYTSGSTGAPKGVELTHSNIIAAMGAAEYLIIEFLSGQDDHSYIGFLPLAHVLEFLVEFIMICLGIPIGYASIRTLMNEFVCGPNGEGKGEGDLKMLKPTIMAGVPAVWEKIKKGVEAKLAKQPWAVRKTFEAAIELKWRMLQVFGKTNNLTDAYDSVIFNMIRDVTGGRLKYGISGGAPVSFETQKFVTSALCFMLQGYGLTECCGLASVTLPKFGIIPGSIGPPSPSIEFRLVDVADTDYKAENNVGELWLRGPSLMRGYHKRPDLTKDAITSDGWFKTGDIARLNDDGTFSITDRAKNLVKLAHGEYIALEALESKYRNCHEIKNICLIADSNKSYIIAVVEPADDDVEKDTLLKKLQQTASSAGCNRVETVKDIVVTRHIDWTKEYMTSSQKIKRKDIVKGNQEEIDKIYK
ncbi:hypothetical protein BDF20DRAFT_838563 [Mycotypha africana]|uniref:uncharacterized protein n=1 Tax=Mycotypha africana TaxID=64632 RepID=UPI0023009CBF|nr:uncharacterized protein BDF20DRAFT_838563 [Mycotypha africana]KAI8970183.1 hypothetical protein BDF20DRAFT_838563 [Mycotypha africana]